MATFEIPYHEIQFLKNLLGAVERKDTIVVVEEIWINKNEASALLGVSHAALLKWLADNGHIERRMVGREYEYNPVGLKRTGELIKAKKIEVPTIRGSYTNAA